MKRPSNNIEFHKAFSAVVKKTVRKYGTDLTQATADTVGIAIYDHMVAWGFLVEEEESKEPLIDWEKDEPV